MRWLPLLCVEVMVAMSSLLDSGVNPLAKYGREENDDRAGASVFRIRI
jgi:hypothetical protein